MAYVGSADTSDIRQKLPDLPHIVLLFQRALGIQLAGPNAALPAEIKDFPTTGDGTVSNACISANLECC